MNEALLIWGYLALGNFLTGALIFLNFLLFCIGFSLLPISDVRDRDKQTLLYKKVYSYGKTTLVGLVFLGTVFLLYPSKDDLKWIIGGSLVWNSIEYASDIEGVDKLPENLVGSMNHFLESLQEEETE